MTKIISYKDAEAAGLKFYFTGNPCPHGHITPRYTSTYTCVGCHKALLVLLREKTKIRQATRILTPRQEAQAAGKSRYTTGKPCPRGHFSARSTANGSCLECNREDRIRREADNPKHKQKKREYRIQKAEVFRCHVRNRRAKSKNVEGSHIESDIVAILKAQKYRCAYCPASIKKSYHVDHIIALSKGGSNWPKNIQLTCEACNLRKWSKDPIDFAKELGKLL